MSARPSASVSGRPNTTNPTRLLFQPSTAGWYAAWKAKKDAPAPAPAAEPEAAPAGDASEALARWLTGGK